MKEETRFEKFFHWIMTKLKLMRTYEISKKEMCLDAQGVCNKDCGNCAWNEKQGGDEQ